MKLDQAGIDLIKNFEGFKSYTYYDSAGLLTIGYGHLIKAGESFPRDISIEEAEALLRSDAQIAVDAVNRMVKVRLNQNQFNALVSLTFNIGVGGFWRSTVLRKINKGKEAEASDAFLLWNKITLDGQLTFSQGLANRRLAESELFLA